jgi:DNA uptake protein ComE-like DNA-binding protein
VDEKVLPRNSENAETAGSPEKNRAALFRFDPNNISEAGWQQLGLSARLASMIMKYRSNGGQFRKPEDLKKIWGMKPEFAETLMPYVSIDPGTNSQHNGQGDFNKPRAFEKKAAQMIDINLAQLEDWKNLPGIGEVLAARIIRYRERCGGFSSIDAVGTTYGIADSVFGKLRPYLKFDERTLPKIDLNQAGIVQLKNRLQLSYAQAKSLIRYREEHGPYTSLDALRSVPGLADTTRERLAGLVRLQ